MKKWFKKLGKAELFGILVDEQRNCFCPSCETGLIVQTKWGRRVDAQLPYEIIADLSHAESKEWQFFCQLCVQIYPVDKTLNIRLLSAEETFAKNRLLNQLDEKFGNPPKEVPYFQLGVKWC